MSMRLQTLSKTLDHLHGVPSPSANDISPLETLLLMVSFSYKIPSPVDKLYQYHAASFFQLLQVNEVLEKLVEGRMEEFIHHERFKLFQDKIQRQTKVPMVTKIV